MEKIINGIKLYETRDGKLNVRLEKDKLVESEKLMLEMGIKGMSITYFNIKGGLDNLEFLKNFEFVERLSITDLLNLPDLNGLKYLPNLKTLILTGFFEKIEPDLSFHKKLKYLDIGVWHKSYKNIFNTLTELEFLGIEKYDGNDLSLFSSFKNLKQLDLRVPRIESLSGIESLQHLEILRVTLCRRLKSVKFIPTSVKDLKLLNCPNVNSLESFNELVNLEILELDNLREIESLKPIKDLTKLKNCRLSGNTIVKDGDMNPLKGKGRIFFPHYKHYTHDYNEL